MREIIVILQKINVALRYALVMCKLNYFPVKMIFIAIALKSE